MQGVERAMQDGGRGETRRGRKGRGGKEGGVAGPGWLGSG